MKRAIREFSVVTPGLIAGQMLAIGIGGYAVRSLPEESWTLRFRKENDLYTKTMRASLMSPLISSAGATIHTHGGRRRMFGIAALFTLLVSAVTFVLEIPINGEVASWTAGKAPAQWTSIRDRWLINHAARVVPGTFAFVFGAIGLGSE